MGFLAQSILRGDGLGSPFGPHTGPTAIVAPGYPLFVSGVFRILGTYSAASAWFLMFSNCVLNGATDALIYRAARNLASEPSAFAVALIWACSPPLLWMPTIFWETNVSAALLLSCVCLTPRQSRSRSSLLWAGSGMLCAITGLINPALLPSQLILAGYGVSRGAIGKREWQAGTIYCSSFLLFFLPWPTRNQRVFHSFIPTRTTLGLELWMGNQLGGQGYLEPALFPTYNEVELSKYKRLGEPQYMAQKQELALRYIRAHPVHFLVLSIRRCTRFWLGGGTRDGSPLLMLHGTFLFVLGASGLVLLWREGRRDLWSCTLIPLILFPLPYYATHAEFKYRLIVDPLLMVLGAGAIDLVRPPGRSRVVAPASVLALLPEPE